MKKSYWVLLAILAAIVLVALNACFPKAAHAEVSPCDQQYSDIMCAGGEETGWKTRASDGTWTWTDHLVTSVNGHQGAVVLDATDLANGSVSNTEFQRLDGVTGGIQAQLDGKFPTPAGNTSQYVRGDGSLATLPTVGAGTQNFGGRSLNTCFQISASNDSFFSYVVDVTAGLVLGGGNAAVTSYTNSGCTTGAQVVADSQNSGVTISSTASLQLVGTVGAGKWAKITASATGVGASVALRANHNEYVFPF